MHVIIKSYDSNGESIFCSGVDEHNNPVKRSKIDFPYSYDGFVIWRGLPQAELTNTIYSDRIKQHFKFEHLDALCKKHFGECGDSFYSRKPKDIESFLQELYEKPNYKLGLIMEYCNVANGFPVWRFDIKSD